MIMTLQRFLFPFLLSLTLLLTGCQNSGDGGSPGTASVGSDTSANVDVSSLPAEEEVTEPPVTVDAVDPVESDDSGSTGTGSVGSDTSASVDVPTLPAEQEVTEPPVTVDTVDPVEDVGQEPPPVVEVEPEPEPEPEPMVSDMDEGMSTDDGMMSMGCDYPGNCPGDTPAEFRVIEGSSGFDVAHTGEMPFNDGERVGAFRTVCEVSHFAYADPIVYPGQSRKGHLHMFFGNTGVSGNSTYSSLRSSGNGTCRGGIANRTAYWVPALLDDNDTPVVPDTINVYYKSGYKIDDPTDVTVIPDGLKMLVGDGMATTPQPLTHVYWRCNGKKSASIGDCYGDLIMDVNFKQCASGALDSPDHKSHLSDPINGACTDPDFPLTIPVITYQIIFKVNGTASWRLSSDMYPVSNGNGGYSLHGDWMDGWDPEIKRTWTEHCSSKPFTSCGSHILGDGRVIFRGF